MLPPDDELTREYKLSACSPTPWARRSTRTARRCGRRTSTRAKPLLVLLWLRLNLARMVAIPGVKDDLQVRTCSEMLDELVVAYNVRRQDRQVAAAAAVLRQLLKIFQIFFVFRCPS